MTITWLHTSIFSVNPCAHYTYDFWHDMIPCHVEFFKQVVWHNFGDHSHLIRYNYKSSCKLSHLKKIPISVRLQAITSRLPCSKQIQIWYLNDWPPRISYEVPTLGTINCD